MTACPIRVEGDIAYIGLTRGYEAVIDKADLKAVDGHKWCAEVDRRADGSVRAVYAVYTDHSGPKAQRVAMHRVLMNGIPQTLNVDHIDGDGLNNRRNNLRLADNAQNQHNRARSANNTSGVKGVVWHKAAGLWQAKIACNGKVHSCGYFKSIDDAAAAYAAASAKLHGEFGRFA